MLGTASESSVLSAAVIQLKWVYSAEKSIMTRLHQPSGLCAEKLCSVYEPHSGVTAKHDTLRYLKLWPWMPLFKDVWFCFVLTFLFATVETSNQIHLCEVLTAVKMYMLVFWVVMLLQPWRWRQYVSPKRWYLPTSPHDVTTQKTNIDKFNYNYTIHAIRPSLLIVLDQSLSREECLVKIQLVELQHLYRPAAIR
jgi:hypothetical protein